MSLWGSRTYKMFFSREPVLCPFNQPTDLEEKKGKVFLTYTTKRQTPHPGSAALLPCPRGDG